MIKINIVTLFPEFIQEGVSYSIIKRAQSIGAVSINPVNPREFTRDRHRTVDDSPYGGGAGMVMKPDVVYSAVESCIDNASGIKPRIILLEPQGKLFTQELAKDFANSEQLILLCGHYEGMDDRIRQNLATDMISIGNYVLTGGELPALVITDAVCRLLPGVLGSEESLEQDSFNNGLLGYPQFTKPADFRGFKVPDILQSGNHGEIAKWRKKQSLRLTKKYRPELLDNYPLTSEDIKTLEEDNQEN